MSNNKKLRKKQQYNSKERETEDEYDDFFQKSKKYSFALKVEGKILFAPKDLLASYSEVFEKMVYGPFKEGELEQADGFTGKKHGDVVEFLRCIVPCPKMKPVTDSNVDLLLEFANMYSIADLKSRCEKFLESKLATVKLDDVELLDILEISSKYNMIPMVKAVIPMVVNLPLKSIQERYNRIKPNVIAAVLEAALLKYTHGIAEQSHPHRVQPLRNGFSIHCQVCNATGLTNKQCMNCGKSLCAACEQQPCSSRCVQQAKTCQMCWAKAPAVCDCKINFSETLLLKS